ncbi:hypothetical protein [Actinacidiphila sp. ITFR-21]|uniref:hypothetical protein n=1 Tax=Actinacidiphila sp. ITFR-21 TaxID=3075199 RepID=UPI00288BBF2A|nr:hypothetical protein [Streptomyces sp. ITFR-21]WNI16609.1 hypothetical protein RLT57_14550 [Streptomyces sp. ITFR-21]
MSAVELNWVACDLRTGVVIEELPSLTASDGLQRNLGSSVSVSADLGLAGAPADWEYATQPGRSMLVAVDRLTQQPLWPGIVLTRSRGLSPTATLGMATPECYLDRRYTGTYNASGGADQVAIMTGVSSALLVNGPPLLVDASASGVTGIYSVQNTDDRSVLSVLQELQGMDGWPEWTIDVQWSDATRSAVQLVLRIRPRIGTVRPDPDAVFDLPGCVTDYAQTESYEAGKGATIVQARGEGEGSSRLSSDVYTATDLIAQGWPAWVYRYTPGTNITDPAALNASAAQTITQQRTGSSTWTITAAASAAPRLGRDWAIGDSIGLKIPIGQSPGHPGGADVVARAYSWKLTPAQDQVSPILIQDDTS